MQNSPDLYQSYFEILSHGHRLTYTLLVILSVVVGSYFIFVDSKSWQISEDRRHTFFRFLGISSFFGAAIPAYFAGGWIGEIAWDHLIGPKTVLGGIVFCSFAALLYKKLVSFNIETGDAFARGACLMMLIGRVGCIVQHCCFGIIVEPQYGIDLGDGHPRLPVQAIEATGLLMIFCYLQWVHQKNYLRYKRLYVFFMLYGALRFTLEFYREQIAEVYFGIGFYQWIALFLFIIGAVQFIRVKFYLIEKNKFNEPMKNAYSF